MKRTTILLEEDVLLEIQQLAKQHQVTTSQVIQRAIADYVETQRQMRLHPPGTDDGPAPLRPSRRTPEPVRYVRETPAPAAEHPSESAQGVEEAEGGETYGLRPILVPLVVGGLSALFALFELVQAIGRFATNARALEVVINHLLPAVLLGVVAAAFFFVASQNRRMCSMRSDEHDEVE
jgi:hypothetical protein